MTPTELRIRMYDVGFGDCFLLSFRYRNAERRHVLIDFGTTAPPEGKSDILQRVARDIRDQTGGKLHVVVATHRHQDHIAGFATMKNGQGPGNIIASLNPDVVLMPWTEDPDAPEDPEGPELANAMNDVAADASKPGRWLASGVDRSVSAQLAFIGEDSVRNVSAVRNLLGMATKHRFLSFGSDPELDTILPGINVRVLGPPTLKQSPAIARMRSADVRQYWMLAAGAAKRRVAGQAKPLFVERFHAVAEDADEQTRWLIPRVDQSAAEQQLGIVTALDGVLNNTSLILLFEVGGRRLLFPGDAQIENWSYALSHPDVVELLKEVDVYKVGHHGSRNATPRTMWEQFSRRGNCNCGPLRLTSLLSTKAGKHGRPRNHTEVPRTTLLGALERDSTLYSTDASNKEAKDSLAVELILTLEPS
jgi:beta-lactamase superfamily II metal-dependent hydrolase